MWFKFISFVLAVACILKSLIGLFLHKKFYAWDRKQYASQRFPKRLFVFILYGLGIFLITWYATIFHYVKHGYILTTIVSLSSIKLLSLLFNWEDTSKKLVRFIDSGGWRLWVLDVFLLVLGVLFFLLGLYVYS